MNDIETVWKKALENIKSSLAEEEFAGYLSKIEFIEAGNDSITLGAPSKFLQDRIKNRYLHLLKSALEELLKKEISIDFIITKKKSTENTEQAAPQVPEVQAENVQKPAAAPVLIKPEKKGSHSQLRKEFIFDNYVVGENNDFAFNAALAISRNPGIVYNPFLIYGGVGMGKTHQMQAIGNHIYSNSQLKVIYITAEEFLNEFVESIKKKDASSFQNKYRYNVDVLLIDDIHFLQDKEGIQSQLFYTFNALTDSNKQVVFTCDRPVLELKKFSDRLKSRINSSLTAELNSPNFETRCAILQKRREFLKKTIPDKVITLIAEKISSNVRDLIGAFTRVVAYSDLVKKPVTEEVAVQQLKDYFISTKQGNLPIEIIQKEIADYFGNSLADLRGPKRKSSIVFPRQLAMFITREITQFSQIEIGQAFNRDHSTVIHACNAIEEKIKADPTLDATIKNLIRKIKESSAKS
jgi:chromosomal replication initiator protein